jgi:plasmid stabilization system protein ParE
MKNYRLSAASKDDLWEIKQSSCAAWGKRQTRSYLAAIEAALERLVISPELGKKRDELIVGLRSFTAVVIKNLRLYEFYMDV